MRFVVHYRTQYMPANAVRTKEFATLNDALRWLRLNGIVALQLDDRKED